MVDCVDFNLDGTIKGQNQSLIQKAVKNGVDGDAKSPWMCLSMSTSTYLIMQC